MARNKLFVVQRVEWSARVPRATEAGVVVTVDTKGSYVERESKKLFTRSRSQSNGF